MTRGGGIPLGRVVIWVKEEDVVRVEDYREEVVEAEDLGVLEEEGDDEAHN